MYLLCGSDFFRSMDRGDSWTRTTGPDGGRIWNLEIGRGTQGTLYGVRSDDIWKSTDAGETWRRAGNLSGVWRLQTHPTNPSVIFAAVICADASSVILTTEACWAPCSTQR